MMNLLKIQQGQKKHNGRFSRNWKNTNSPAITKMREKIKFEEPLFYDSGLFDRPLSPLELHLFFFMQVLIQEIVKESMLYSVQKGRLQYQLSVELKIFLVILLIMVIVLLLAEGCIGKKVLIFIMLR